MPHSGSGTSDYITWSLRQGDVISIGKNSVPYLFSEQDRLSGLRGRWSHADLLASVMRVAEAGSAEREASLPLRLRRGLPFDFLATHGLQARPPQPPLQPPPPPMPAAGCRQGAAADGAPAGPGARHLHNCSHGLVSVAERKASAVHRLVTGGSALDPAKSCTCVPRCRPA